MKISFVDGNRLTKLSYLSTFIIWKIKKKRKKNRQ